MSKNPKMHYQTEASVIKPVIVNVLKHSLGVRTEFIDELTKELVTAVLKAQRKHNHEVIGEE